MPHRRASRDIRGPMPLDQFEHARRIESAGQHEFRNWICLAGAMSEIGARVEIIDYMESYVMNSNKCFAVMRP